MSLIKSLEWRYAAKKMNGEKIPQDKIDFILDATRLSASSVGLQPYSIIVVSNQEVKEKLVPAANNQSQVKDSSHVLVFATWDKIDEKHIDTFIADVAAKRNVPLESLNDYKEYIKKAILSMPVEKQNIWAAKQAYIALGTALAAAAEVQVDATPMEGFVPEQFDEILGLKAKGLKSVVILPLGYRSAEDWLAPLPKVRRDKELLFEMI
ncbi:nitroreductase family protein [Chitinophagaceae bacterium LWZ2-11]